MQAWLMLRNVHIIATLAAGLPSAVSAAPAAPSVNLETIVYTTIKAPEAVRDCIAAKLRTSGARPTVEPHTRSPRNDAWTINFRHVDTPASVLIASQKPGALVAYPRQVAIMSEQTASSIEDCG